MAHYLFTSESVSEGHPDKIADQISDAILDACLKQDTDARVACETLVSGKLVVIAGEISMEGYVDYTAVIRETIKQIGYENDLFGFSDQSCEIFIALKKQSFDIVQAMKEGGAGDQGLMFGYACDETPALMPLPIMLAHQLISALRKMRKKGGYPYLRPDAKTQVTVEYDENNQPLRVHTIVISTQHSEDTNLTLLKADLKDMACQVIPRYLIDEDTLFYINPAGRFVIGGPLGDCGITGRKIMVDSYGGMGRHGGGCFSGKDSSKMDRTGAYAARYVAKHIVAAKLAMRCEVQISYAIGISHPLSIKIDTFGTSTVSEEVLLTAVKKVFDLTPSGIIKVLNLQRPIYLKTAVGGHFGRLDEDFTWETTNQISNLLEAL